MTDTKALLEEIKREYALRSEIVRNGPRLKELVYSVYGANLCFKHVPECDALIAVTAGSYVVMWDARDYHILDAQLLLVPFTIVPSVACFISTSAAMLEFAVVSKQGTCITYRMHFKGSAFCASAPPLPSFAPPTSAKLPSGFNVDLNNSRAATPEPSNPDAPQKTLTEDLRDNQFKEPPRHELLLPQRDQFARLEVVTFREGFTLDFTSSAHPVCMRACIPPASAPLATGSADGNDSFGANAPPLLQPAAEMQSLQKSNSGVPLAELSKWLVLREKHSFMSYMCDAGAE
jgi:hypothetical protein